MALYVTGLVLIIGAVELVLAVLIVLRSSVPSDSAAFWSAYFGAIVVLGIVGALLVRRGLRGLRSAATPADPSAERPDPTRASREQ